MPNRTSRTRRNARGPLIASLELFQSGTSIEITFSTQRGVRATALWALQETHRHWTLLASLDPSEHPHSVRVDLAALASDSRLGAEGDTARLHVELEPSAVDGETTAPVRRAMGRAARTQKGQLTPVEVDGRILAPYLSRGGVVSVAIGRDLNPFGEVHVQLLRGRGGVLRMRGRINSRHTVVERAELQLRGRTSGRRLTEPVQVIHDPRRTARRYGQHWYRFAAELDWATLWNDGQRAGNDIFDAWMLLHLEGQAVPHPVRVGKTRFFTRQLSRPTWARSGDSAAAIMPYYTLKTSRTSFQVDAFEADALQYMRSRLRTRHLDRFRFRGRPIWLVGEMPYKAQDTGLAMFGHLRRNHPEIDAYYVMDSASPEFANVEPLGNVLEHRSPEHIRLSLLAHRVLGSHHLDFLYPLRTSRFRRAVRAKRIFLQHGVMGTKWMVPNYGKGRGTFEADLIIASSEREKQYLISDFGFQPDEVAVTGLSRFDSLFADDVAVRRQIMIMPTWRDWLLDADIYLESEYHDRWSSLLHSPRLRALAQVHGLDIVLCLHPNMRASTALFSDTPARVISQGEVDVQHLLKESAVLVTDYSSVGFDFAFLDKPVVYFQFDRARFLGQLGSHLDLDAELPGTIVPTENTLFAALEQICANGFAMQPGMRERADRFIAHRDRNNSERIYAAAQDARRHSWKPNRILNRPLPAAAFRFWRRSRIYFPMMRAMFNLLQRLPADADRVVFEAGVGRQYADSPRYIYEELVRRRSTMRKVWAYRGKIHTADANTTVVQRLSPGYFWHLGRAKYWVNSQNLPHYLRRRPGRVFVQTWHGTPLKRMLLDAAAIEGRDAGYIERMTRAAAQWSVLVSPSPYATKAISGAYGYSGSTLEVGYPRNDILLSPDRDHLGAVVRTRLGIAADARVILYAPTFRDDQKDAGRFRFTLPFDLDRVQERLGPNTVLLLRMHVLISKAVTIPAECAHNVLDVSGYPEIQELYLASDAAITDYSSVFFDFALLRRPIVFYAYDLDDYRDRLRGFYLDYFSELPGPIVTSEAELLDTLDDLDAVAAAYAPRFDDFLERFAPHDDGHAAERVVDAVFGRLGSQQGRSEQMP